MRDPGLYSLEELTSDIDGSVAYQVPEDGRNRAFSGSWDAANADIDAGIRWSCEGEDDAEDDGMEVALTVQAYASLVRRARRHCEACTGCCDR
jgi:hypothetical protein